MRFKVDENLPDEVCNLLNSAGHDAISVGQQGLGGAADARIYQLCQNERRVLITLDVDFANVQAYDPKSSVGVIVLRLARQDRQRVLDAVATTLTLLGREPLENRLWIVEGERIRIRA
jgi:predicted nuclease of predicted toxin-antitoxin system